MSNKNTGYVYLLTNPVMPGLVKIGMTERQDLEQRLRELYTTGVPVPFECVYAARVNQGDCRRIERALHTAFGPQRVNENREFFRINPEQAKVILELFHHEDATDEVSEEINKDLTAEDKAAVTKSKSRRPSLNFYEMGLQKGEVLVWREDPTISVVIDSERSVIYEGESKSLSALSAQLKHYNTKHIAPGSYWLYKDRVLGDIYDETYPMEE